MSPRTPHRFLRRSLVILLLFATPTLATAGDPGFPAGAETAATLHPSQLMLKAPPLMAAGRQKEASFWLYAGQLRWRTRLSADPGQDPSGEPALFASLIETVGPSVNGWAFGDTAELGRTIDAVLAWDEAYPDPSLPAALHATTRAGLVKLRDQISREADAIRAERTANGLDNR